MSDELKQENAAPVLQTASEEAPAVVVPTVGEQLRSARTALGMTVNEAAHTLMLAPRQIEALENNQWDKLPGDTFVRGFIRNYGKLLKLDVNVLVAQLQAEQQSHAQPNIEMPQALAAELPQAMHAKKRDKATVLAAVGLVGVALLVYFLLPEDLFKPQPKIETNAEGAAPAVAPMTPTTLPDSSAAAPTAPVATDAAVPAAATTPVTTPPAPAAETKAAPAVVAPATPAAPVATAAPVPAVASTKPVPPVEAAKPAAVVPAPVNTAAPAALPAGAIRLKFVFAESSWVEVKDAKGQLLVSSKHGAGSEREVGGVGPLSVTIGNASHVRLQVNGKPVDLQPSANDVARLTLP